MVDPQLTESCLYLLRHLPLKYSTIRLRRDTNSDFFFLLFQLDGRKKKKVEEKKASPCVASVCLGGDDDVTERASASQKGRQQATEAGITCSG